MQKLEKNIRIIENFIGVRGDESLFRKFQMEKCKFFPVKPGDFYDI